MSFLSLSFRALCLGFAVLLAVSTAHAAEEKPATLKGDWQVGMIKDDKGAFGYCLMRGVFNNDLSLAVALSPKQELNLGVGVPKAGFAKDEKHQMIVSIDKLFKKGAVAVAAEPELLIMPMGNDKNLVTSLRKGKVLVLAGREDEARFSLSKISKALDGLKQCVDVGTGKIKPSEAKTDAPAADKKGKQGKAGQFPQGLKDMLVKAGLSDLEIVPIKDPSKAPVDFAWRTAGVFGGMRERKVPEEATIEKMTDILEKGYKGQCNGTFENKLGEIEDIGGIKMRKADISCQMKEQHAYVSLFFYLTDTKIFSFFMHETNAEGKEKANGARDKIAAFIRELAKQEKPKQ